MILKKKISTETKSELLRMTIFLLIQAVILLLAISGVYLFIAEPMIKNVWDNIIKMNDDIVVRYINSVKESSNSLDIFTGNTDNTDNESQTNIDTEDMAILSNNDKIQKKAIEMSLIVGLSIILIVSIAIFFTKYRYSSILYHSIVGFLVVATTYSLFSFLFISPYDTLDTHKAIQHFLVVANNTINPDDKIQDVYKQ